MWPISPANPVAPMSGRPPTMSPPPTPTSPDTKSASSTPTAAPRRCSARIPASASFAMAIGTVTASARASRAPSGTSTQPRLGAIVTTPSSRRTTPATATPIPMIGPSSRARSSPARARRSATTSSTESCLRGRSIRIWSIRSPPSPTIAAAIESTRISRLSTTAPVGHSRTSGEGRPGVPRRTGSSSVTMPASASSPTSVRIALLVSPVAWTSSERDCGPSSCRPRMMALRLARCAVSLRCPTSTRPSRTICDPFLQTCARLMHGSDRVKSRGRVTPERGSSGPVEGRE